MPKLCTISWRLAILCHDSFFVDGILGPLSRLFMRVRVIMAMDIAEFANNDDSADNDNHGNNDDKYET